MSSQGRDPAKRKVKPVEAAQSLLDFDLEGESSDDSDFRIEDHPEESDDYSINSDDEKKNEGSGSSDGSESEEDVGFKTNKKMGEGVSVVELLERAKNHEFNFPGNIAEVLICAGCLGSRSDAYNEIVECDGCGVTVHEGCYGVSDVASESSTISSASTEPWFCEACKAGVQDPNCELCPNKGGIFKETEVGAWVHLVCALYVPGVAFSEVERLSGVTLFEMAYSRWGARSCALCEDVTLARTGVCVGCDAGLCKTYFHVTCGQREGLLAEAHSEELEQADPFYAHCRLHSDKALINKRKRNWLVLQLRTEKRKLEMENKLSEEAKMRIKRKLVKYKNKYLTQKENRNPPWVPTQKMARMLYSSASAMRKFQRKAECMGLDIHALEFQDAQMSSLKDVSRRWHVGPAFSVEFVGYYLERNTRVTSLRHTLDRLTSENVALVATEEKLRPEYEQVSKANADALAELSAKRAALLKLYEAILALCPDKVRPELLDDKPLVPPVYQRSTPKVTPQQLHKRTMPVPTAAALKMGVGFPLSDRAEARQGKVLSTSVEAQRLCACAVCGRTAQRAALAACDTCGRHYHPHCLQPPLQRPPKKTKLYGWQCSECDKSSDSEPDPMEKKAPRRSRIRYSKDGAIIRDSTSPFSSPSPKKTPKGKPGRKPKTPTVNTTTNNVSPIKVTIKPFEFTSENEEIEPLKKDRKIKKIKQKSDVGAKKIHKRSFTSPTLTNTPLMSITPIVADSPNDSHNENSNASTAPTTATKEENSFASPNTSFSSLLNEAKEKKERYSKSIENSIETTFANLSSDIATYKANRKRRKEKHRSRYSPDLLRSTSKHKHKRKKKNQDMENPEVQDNQENSENHENQALPKITIKIKPFVKPDGTLDRQIFYVPSESGEAPTTPTKTSSGPPSKTDTPSASTSPIIKDNSSPVTPVGRPPRGQVLSGGKAASLPPLTECDVCKQPGDGNNIVRCDECNKRYHFTCLEPPLNKNPKKRGYSWHCADCDPTDTEDNH